MLFNYVKYLCQMLVYNRRPMVVGMAGEDIAKFNLINFEDLDQSGDKFRQKRKRYTEL